MNIYGKLNAAREAFHTLSLKKTGLNKFAGYQYFELGDFLIPAMRVFKDAGLCAVVSFDKDIATMRIMEVEGDGLITITSPMGSAALKGCHEVQNIGAVETYQRRYLWVAALEIVEHDALDATTGRDAPAGKKKDVPVITATRGEETLPEDQMQYLREMAMDVIGMVKDGNALDAYKRIEADKLDDVQKPTLWGMLDSKTRSAITAAKPINYMRA